MILNFGKRKRLKMHLQAEAAECGLCCLVMVSGFFGYETDLVSLRRKHGISMRGATLKSVMEIAEEVKLSSRALKVELEELKNLKLPAILHWNLDHFVVLSKVSRNNVTIYDPAVGIRRYSLKEVSQKFTGIALELSPRSDFSKINEASPLTIWSFWEGANGLGASLVQILILSILIQIFSLATPFYMQIVVDDVLVKHDSDLLLLLAFGFFGVTLISVITKALRGFASLYLVNQLSYNIGNSVLHQLIRLPMSYFEKRHMGDILSRFGSTGPIQSFITGSAVAVIIDGLLAITTLILMLVYSPLLTGIVAASVAVYAVFGCFSSGLYVPQTTKI